MTATVVLAGDTMLGRGVADLLIRDRATPLVAPQALLDTLCHLERAGIAAVGAGADDSSAREPLLLGCGPFRVRVVAFSDHPAAYAAGPRRARCGGPSRPSGRTRPGWSRRSTGRHRSRDSSPRNGARAPRCARPVGRGACGRRAAAAAAGTGDRGACARRPGSARRTGLP